MEASCGVRRATWTHSAIIPCLKKLILFVGKGYFELDPAKRPKKLNSHSSAGVELLRLRDKIAALR